MRKLTFGMNLSLDGYIAAPGDDLGWSVPSDELFQWWSDRVGATGLALYGRKLWETMSSHWPTADQQPGATPAQIEFARRWRDMPKVVFSSTTSAVDWNARLVTGAAVTEITRLKTEDGGPLDVGGANLVSALRKAGRERNREVKAAEIQACLRQPQLEAAPLLTQAYGRSVTSIVHLVRQLNQELVSLEQELSASFELHPDAEIYLSLPGLGKVLGARVMAEFGDDRTRFENPKARKSFAGTAPITKPREDTSRGGAG